VNGDPQLDVIRTYQELLEDILKQPFSEQDALVWMILLHTHKFCLQDLTPGAEGTDQTDARLAALTRRSAGEVIAHFWPDRSDERASYYYWYWLYSSKTPFEDLSEVPANLMARLVKCRDLLAKNPRIRAIEEDE
jgi:hypothetical protein